ncbi:MAG: potassium-transporting ATPase subunit C [Thermoplasmata archaeon]
MTARAPRPASPLDPIPDETATEVPIVPPPHHPYWGHLRASIVLLVLTIFLLGLAYPGAITVFAQKFEPASANGSLIFVNGTAVGSSLIAQNLSAPWLFWERPSPEDYNSFNGSPTLLGYSDPALVNETKAYMQQYGPYTVNATVPEILVTVSGSGLDPDLTPEAALVQIPRIAHATNLSMTFLQALVNAHVVPPLYGFIGPSYVDVLKLDLALLPYEHRSV